MPICSIRFLLCITATACCATLAHAAVDVVAPKGALEALEALESRARVTDTVVIEYPKNAAVMAYDEMYERLKRMQDSKLDRVRLQIKLKSKNAAVAPAQMRIAIVNDHVTVPLPITADGGVTLPLRADLYKTSADIRSNQPKGTMEVSVDFGVSWPRGTEVSYAEVEETARQIQLAGKDLLGWFGYMLFFPSLANFEVPVQYPAPNGQTMTVLKDGRVIERYAADNKGLLTFRLKREWAQLQPTLVFSEAMPQQ